MSDPARRGFLKRAGATLAAVASGVLPWATGTAATGPAPAGVGMPRDPAPADCPPAAGRVATVWLGYALCVPSGEGEAYRPPRRIGGPDKLPAVFHVS